MPSRPPKQMSGSRMSGSAPTEPAAESSLPSPEASQPEAVQPEAVQPEAQQPEVSMSEAAEPGRLPLTAGPGRPAPAPAALPPVTEPTPPLPAAPSAGGEPVAWQWPTVHREGWRFAAAAGFAALVAGWAGWPLLGWTLAGLTVFILAFFRDPLRTSPLGDGLILSPADGVISQIMEVELPRQLVGEGALDPGRATRVSIFMSVFDVHINRTPMPGTIRRLVYVPGAFLNADLDKASEENERQYLLVEANDGTRVGFTQIAGLVARRIVSFVREGSIVGTGQRVGLIRFGSRVDVFLPAGFEPQVVKGQRAVAGETVLARRGGLPLAPGPRQ